jgi:hypothetical protein
VVDILAHQPSPHATFAELFEAVPLHIALSDADRELSESRPNEEKWQVRLRNIASHAAPDGSIRHQPQLVRTEGGLSLRETDDIKEEIKKRLGNLTEFNPFVTRLAIAGCTEVAIATITDHSLRSVRAILNTHYLARDPALAESAIRKLESRTKSPNWLQCSTKKTKKHL